MNARQLKDAAECEQMADKGLDKDCNGCSCRVCLVQEGELLHSASLGQAYQWAHENGIVTIDPESLVKKFKESGGKS